MALDLKLVLSLTPTDGLPSFNYSACNVAIVGPTGGGDTFDCYTAGNITSDSTPIQNPAYQAQTLSGGTGIGMWLVADGPFGFSMGDTFDSYNAEADPITQSLNAGSGIGTWILT